MTTEMWISKRLYLGYPMSQQNAGVDESGGVASNSGRLRHLDTVPPGDGVNIIIVVS